uniref:Uncharacterized protein n=1 Tax=Marmota marmota marmota TaxID=9994 RepID=A0A8C5ZQ91_MARMA
ITNWGPRGFSPGILWPPCAPPAHTVVDCRETLHPSPSFSTDSALFSLLTTNCDQYQALHT